MTHEPFPQLKKHFGSKLIAFGAHITGLPEGTLEALPEIDIGIIGEPELVILDIIKNGNLQERKVNNIVYRNLQERLLLTKYTFYKKRVRRSSPACMGLAPIRKVYFTFYGGKIPPC